MSAVVLMDQTALNLLLILLYKKGISEQTKTSQT